MHTPITPNGGAIGGLPPNGPPCHHNEPTVLKVLSGRNVYVCSRFPNHHCRACCPADVMLLDESTNRPSPLAELAPAPALQPFGSPLPGEYSPMAQSQELPIGSPLSPDNELEAPADSSTPDSNIMSGGRSKSPQRMPAAPTKRSTPHSGATSRIIESGAARSLTPIFNGFSAAASRAQQLGGRFAKIRPHAQTIAKMQKQMSNPTTSTPISSMSQSHLSRKRTREEGPSPRALAAAPYGIHKAINTPAAGGAPALSVQTVSRGAEVRRAWNGNRGGLHKLLHAQPQQQQQQQQPQNQN